MLQTFVRVSSLKFIACAKPSTVAVELTMCSKAESLKNVILMSIGYSVYFF